MLRWHGNCDNCNNKNGWYNNPNSITKLNYAKEMTKRREVFIKSKFPNYKFVTIQECEFQKMFEGSTFSE